MISHSARLMGTSLAFSMIALAAGVATAGGGGGPVATEKDTIGVFNPTTTGFALRNFNSAGTANISASYGPSNGRPLIGDWDGNATDTLGSYSPSLGRFLLRNSNTEGTANITVNFGPTNNTTLVPIVGDWDGVGPDTVGLYDRVAGRFLLRNTATTGKGVAEVNTRFGPKNDTNIIPLTGNWDGTDSTDGIGLYDPDAGTFYLKNNAATGGPADLQIRFGPRPAPVTMIPIVGNWNNDGTDTIGLYDRATGMFMLRNTNSAGATDLTFRFGPNSGQIPVKGNYDNLP